MAVINKKITNQKNESREIRIEIQFESTPIQKKLPSLILFERSFHFMLAKLIFLKQTFI